LDYVSDIAKAKKPMRLLAGEDDELFHTSKFAGVFAKAGKPIEVTLIPRTKHIGLTLNSDAVQAVVNVTKIAP
jgi:alpha-beta hydrolase superfamily lysophospholipase